MGKAIVPCVLLMLCLGMGPRAALAHPIDEYLQAAYVTPAQDTVAIELTLSPGLLVVPQVLKAIDTDADGAFSAREQQAYVERVRADLSLQADGRPLDLTPSVSQFPEKIDSQAGFDAIRMTFVARLPAAAPGVHTLTFQNNHLPGMSAYQANAMLAANSGIQITQQSRDVQRHTLAIAFLSAGAAAGDASGVSAWAQADAAPALAALALAALLSLGIGRAAAQRRVIGK